jgi:glycosyltransferase involved in cell wall biosynthesis
MKSHVCVLDLTLLEMPNLTGVGQYIKYLSAELFKHDYFNYHYFGPSIVSQNHASAFPIGIDLNIHNKSLLSNLLDLIIYTEEADLFFSPFQPIMKPLACKSIMVVHDLIALKHPEWSASNSAYDFFNSSIRLGVENATHVIADSISTKNDIIEFFGTNPNKITCIHLAADNKRFYPNEHNEPLILNGILYEFPFILSVSTLEPRKNLLRLILSFEIFKQNHKCQFSKSVKLVLTGDFGWKQRELFELIKKSLFKEDIIVTGYISDDKLAKLYRKAKLFIYPSLYEGFGLPILEAMMSGTPVLTSKNSSLEEVGGDGVTYIDPLDVNSISKGIEMIIFDHDYAEEFIEKGLTRSKLFSWDKTTKKTIKLFNSILQNH